MGVEHLPHGANATPLRRFSYALSLLRRRETRTHFLRRYALFVALRAVALAVAQESHLDEQNRFLFKEQCVQMQALDSAAA